MSIFLSVSDLPEECGEDGEQENGARESHGCGGRGSHEPLEFISTFCNDVKKCQHLPIGTKHSIDEDHGHNHIDYINHTVLQKVHTH